MISCTTLPLLVTQHFCDFLNIFFEPGAIFLIITSVILTLVFSIALSMLITLSPKRSLWGATGGGISAVLHIIIVIIGVTGCFGFTTKIPDLKDIESVDVSVPFGDMTYTNSNEFFTPFNYADSITLSEESEIKIATNTHKIITENQEKTTGVTFDAMYRLKNGKIICRSYCGINEDAALEYSRVWESKDIKNRLKVFLNQAEAKDVFSEKFDIDINSLQSTESSDYYIDEYFNTLDDLYPTIKQKSVHIISKDKQTTDLYAVNKADSFPETSEEIAEELMKALYKDACTLSTEEWFSPEKELGILAFCPLKNWNYSPVTFNFLRTYDAVFYINTNMKNTLSVLEKYNYTQYFECKKEITEAHLVNINEVSEWLKNEFYPDYDVPHRTYFAQDNTGIDQYLAYGCGYMGKTFIDKPNLPKQEQIYDLNFAKDMVKNAYMAYNVGIDGEFLVVKFDDGSCSMLVIPE